MVTTDQGSWAIETAKAASTPWFMFMPSPFIRTGTRGGTSRRSHAPSPLDCLA